MGMDDVKRVGVATATFGFSEVYRAMKPDMPKQPKPPTQADAIKKSTITKKQQTKYSGKPENDQLGTSSTGDGSILGITLRKV
jgi:hypothetical protein